MNAKTGAGKFVETDNVKEFNLIPPAKKKAKAKKKVPTMSKWVPILRVAAYDFDEASGKFLDSSQIVELQQEAHSKKIKAVVVPD